MARDTEGGQKRHKKDRKGRKGRKGNQDKNSNDGDHSPGQDQAGRDGSLDIFQHVHVGDARGQNRGNQDVPEEDVPQHSTSESASDDGENTSKIAGTPVIVMANTSTTTTKTASPGTASNAAKQTSRVMASNTTKTAQPLTVSNPTAQSHVSTASSPTVPVRVLIGAVLAAVVLTGAALLVCYFRVRRRRRITRLPQPATTNTGNGIPFPFRRPRQAVLEPYIFSNANANAVQENIASVEFTATMWQRGSITKGSQINPAAAPSSTLQQLSMDLVSAQRGNEHTGRRAVDAGPVANNAEDEDDGESTLPPEYGDVFNLSRSPTVSSRR